ncbi:YwiC-like family protein [Micromonospora sp. NPDC005806]|uniref:YwiC-like family protein n=1 Tax=Micromonospora sp. NPDC005806 TaxID=3364234 RepID=UPI003686A849
MGHVDVPVRPGDAQRRRPGKAGRRKPGNAARRRRFIPPQHGAWAMLVVPYLAGLVAAGYRWPDAPLLGAWIAGYLLSYYAFQAVKSRRVQRYRTQLVLYAAVAAPLALLVVVARPGVLVYAPGYAALFAVNTWYAARRQERAFVNDLASVLQSCLMVFVVAAVADVPPAAVFGMFVLCVAYFVGTVCYVKTIIRERGNPTYLRLSVGYHVLALAVAAWFGLMPAALFAWLLARAALLPGRGWTPKRTGVVEIVNCALMLLVAGTALA